MRVIFQVKHAAWGMAPQDRCSQQTPESAIYWQWWIEENTAWVAGLGEGTAFRSAGSSTPSVHPDKPSQTQETNLAVDTNGQAHLATRVHWGLVTAPISHLIFNVPNSCSFSSILETEKQKKRKEGSSVQQQQQKNYINQSNHGHGSLQLLTDTDIQLLKMLKLR